MHEYTFTLSFIVLLHITLDKFQKTRFKHLLSFFTYTKWMLKVTGKVIIILWSLVLWNFQHRLWWLKRNITCLQVTILLSYFTPTPPLLPLFLATTQCLIAATQCPMTSLRNKKQNYKAIYSYIDGKWATVSATIWPNNWLFPCHFCQIQSHK